jgi:hypothetical protein
MSNAMRRAVMAGALALGAVGVVGAVGVGVAEAKGATGTSFGGSYVGAMPGDPSGLELWQITIGKSGQVNGSLSHMYQFGSVTGRVRKDVASIEGSSTWSHDYTSTTPIAFTATLAVNGSGDIQGTTGAGQSFVWYRQ